MYYKDAARIQNSILSKIEKKILEWISLRLPQ